MTPINAASIPRNRRHEDNPPPALRLHVLDYPFDEQEGGPQIHGQSVVEFLCRDVPYLRDAFAVPGVGDEDVWGAVAVLGLDLGEKGSYLAGGGDVDLMDCDEEGGVLGLEFLLKGGYGCGIG